LKTIMLSDNRCKSLNKVLAEWAGFESFITIFPGSQIPVEYWRVKDRKEKESFILNFPYSLSNCYEWLVPKMKSCSIISQEGQHEVKIVFNDGSRSEMSSDSAVLSLCLALEKLIVDK